MPPLVSILIPAYNAEEWIADTLESAIGQTWPRKEIIVVDDGSTDRTVTIAKQFASKSVSILTQENQGAATARNKAFGACQGDYVQYLDADDLLAPNKIETQLVPVMDGLSNKVLLSSAWASFAYRVSKPVFAPTSLWQDLSPIEWVLRCMGEGAYMQTTAWLVSRQLTEAAGLWDPRLSLDDDGEYFNRVVLASDAVRFVPDAKAYYRRASYGSLSNLDPSSKKWESQFLSIRLQIARLRSVEDSVRVRSACVNYLRAWMIFFYPDRSDIVEELQALAAQLGERLGIPQLGWKYAWIQKVFGWKLGKRTQMFMPRLKWSLIRSWDKALCRIEQRKGVKGRGGFQQAGSAPVESRG